MESVSYLQNGNVETHEIFGNFFGERCGTAEHQSGVIQAETFAHFLEHQIIGQRIAERRRVPPTQFNSIGHNHNYQSLSFTHPFREFIDQSHPII